MNQIPGELPTLEALPDVLDQVIVMKCQRSHQTIVGGGFVHEKR
ncbi:hypothetical protein [Pseudomonas syringae]|nr:hypothetical protein [Pseudomonas syringae]